MLAPMDRRWNHNLHYYPLLIDAVSADAERVLDVGCGEGSLSRALRCRAMRVTGIDLDEASIALARASPMEGVEYLLGDVLKYPFELGSFDAVASVATLHHMDTVAGLRRMAALLRPGGVLALLGLARDDSFLDHARGAFALIANWVLRAQKGYWEHPSPKRVPPESWASMERLAEAELPGVLFRRHLLWRYSIVWKRPGG